jgi:hypothetical protein
MHVEIRVNKEEATLAVLADGILIAKWKDEAGFAGRGSGLVFFSQQGDVQLKISNLRVSEWDGKFEDERPSEMKVEQDVLHLANRDRVTGKLGSLKDGKLKIIAAENGLEIPLQRVSRILFRNEGRPVAARPVLARTPWEVRAIFAGGEKLSLQLEKWDDKEAVGQSAALGRVTFDPQTVRQLQFNLDKAKPETEVAAIEPAEETPQFTPASEGMAEGLDAILFRNGDLIYGNLVSYRGDSALKWTRDDVVSPIDFKPQSPLQIRLRQKQAPQSPSDCIAQLVNGDRIEGRLAAVDSDKVVLETAFAGQLNLARKRVLMISPLPPSRAPIFEGPTTLDGWTHGKVNAVQDAGLWTYRDGAFYATKASSIARDMKLPDVGKIQFDLAWKGALTAAIALYTSSLQPVNLASKDSEPDFGGFYSLQINSIQAALMVVKKDAPLRHLWQMPSPNFTQKSSARFEIYVNKPKRTVTIFIDGVGFKHMIDHEEFAGTGTAMRFVHQGVGTLKLSNLKIAEWDGQFEEKPENGKGEMDLTKLRNGDRMPGELQAYRNGKFTVASASGKLDVPLERVKQIEFAGKKLEAPHENPAEVTAIFRSGASLVFQIESWDDKAIVAISPNFGRATFNPSAFARIEFRPSGARVE